MVAALLQRQLLQLLVHIGQQRRLLLRAHHPDCLHDLRISLRSIRALLPLLAAPACSTLRQRWRSLAAASNPARDLEVQSALLAQLLPAHPLTNQLDLAAEQARNDLQNILSGPTLDRLLLDTSRAVVRCQRLRHKQLRKRQQVLLQRLRTRLASIAPDSLPAQWHALRLDIKRLRYLLEASGVLPAHKPAIVFSLKKMQSALGDLHDLDNLAQLDGFSRQDQVQLAAARARALQHALMELPALTATLAQAEQEMLRHS